MKLLLKYDVFSALYAAFVDLGLAALIFVALHLQERWLSRIVSRRLGWRGILFTAWIGVPVHELSHLVMAKLFGHHIVKYRLFAPDPATGTLGYVWHRPSKATLFQQLGTGFIAIAPALGGVLALWLIVDPHLGAIGAANSSWSTSSAFFQLIVDSLRKIESWPDAVIFTLRMYVAACIATHLAPSFADLKNAARGLWIVASIVFAVLFLSTILGVPLVATGGMWITTIGPFWAAVTGFQALYAAVVWVLFS